MKKTSTLLFLMLLSLIAFSQGNWYQKESLSGTSRYAAASFSIGTKGYVGTGIDASGFIKDLWEWDQATDVWTQKADYPEATGMAGCFGFAVSGKGYIGAGSDGSNNLKSFYEYDPTNNTWTKKPDYPKAVQLPFAFVVNNKAYVGGGYDGSSALNAFYEWDPSFGSWSGKADINGPGRYSAVSFAINGKGYVTTGTDATNYLGTTFEYNPSNNTWKKKADFGGIPRFASVGFAVNGKGYVGLGRDGSYQFIDFWSYDPVADNWVRAANYRNGPRFWAVSFVISDKGYVTTGAFEYASATILMKDIWEFNDKAPGFMRYPMDTTICLGGKAVYSVHGYGDNVQYKWQKNGSDITNYSNDSFLIIDPVSQADTGLYRCIIKNSYGTDTSYEAMVNVASVPLPNITKQPQPTTVCINKPIKVDVLANSQSKAYYQWYRDGKPIKGANDSLFTLNKLKHDDTGYYYCEVMNFCGATKSDSVLVTTYPPLARPTITREWNTLISSEAHAYHWRKFNVPISGATNQKYSPNDKGKYSVEVSDQYGCSRLSEEYTFNFSAIDDINGQVNSLIYPNPSKGTFYISFNVNDVVDIKVVNLLGRTVYEETDCKIGLVDRKQINLDDADNGVYMLIIKGDMINTIEKVTIQK